MGVKLYKATGSGVDVKVFDPFSVESAMLEGWFLTEDGRKAVSLPTFKEVDTNNTGKLSNKEVRKAAKKAGIEGWDTTRISNLKEQLGF